MSVAAIERSGVARKRRASERARKARAAARAARARAAPCTRYAATYTSCATRSETRGVDERGVWGRRVGRRRGSGDRDEGRADRRRAENRCAISRFLSTRCAETIPRALVDDGALALRRCRVGERAVLRRRGGRGRNEGRDRQRRAEAAMQISCDAELCVHVLPAEVPYQSAVLLRWRQPSVPERLEGVLGRLLGGGRHS